MSVTRLGISLRFPFCGRGNFEEKKLRDKTRQHWRENVDAAAADFDYADAGVEATCWHWRRIYKRQCVRWMNIPSVRRCTDTSDSRRLPSTPDILPILHINIIDCSARGPGIESRYGQLCLSCVELCAPFLHCLYRSTQPTWYG